MRVAQVAPVAMPVRGESGRSVEQLVHLLTEELVRRGHQVTLFATADSVTSARLESVYPRGYGEDHDLWDWGFHESMNVARAFELAEQFDVIHSHAYHFALPFTRLVNVPVLHTFHVAIPADVLRAYRACPQAHLVSISAYQRAQVDGLGDAVVHHGIDPDRFPFSGSPGDYLLFLGQMEPSKGPVQAIESARAAGLPLILAGPETDYYRRAVAPLVDGEQVCYLGSVGTPRRNELLAGAGALLYPIQSPEPFGMVMIEAMACGTPVVANDLGAVREIVEPGVTGALIADPARWPQAIHSCLSLDRRRIRAQASQRFSHRRMAEEYEQLYVELCAGSPSGAEETGNGRPLTARA